MSGLEDAPLGLRETREISAHEVVEGLFGLVESAGDLDSASAEDGGPGFMGFTQGASGISQEPLPQSGIPHSPVGCQKGLGFPSG